MERHPRPAACRQTGRYAPFLRAALGGGRVDGDFETFDSNGFALPTPPEHPPRLLVAACGRRALQLAATEADGVVLNWMSGDDLDRVEPLPDDRSRVSLVVPVCPTADPEVMQQVMRPVLADYLMAPAYADQQRRLGRGPVLEPMWQAWSSGDRPGAQGIRVNAIAPGLVRTPLISQVLGEAVEELVAARPTGRIPDPAHVADLVLWLCSPAAEFVTGEAIQIA